MTRILALWLPNWPVQRLIRVKPELKQQPLILYQHARRGQSVAACSRAAWQLGVRIDMPLAEAAALGHQYDGLPRRSSQNNDGLGGPSYCEPHDPFEDHKRLEELAVWCHRFSPLVGLAEDKPVESLLLDVTGIAPLFGGEQSLNQQIEAAFLQQHLTVRIGLASTVGAAWALAHYAHERVAGGDGHTSAAWVGEPPENNDLGAHYVRPQPPSCYACSGLLELPITALRLPSAIVGTLTRLGLERIGDLIPLPRNELKARFGAILLQRLDQALGKQPEIISPIHTPSDFTVESVFEHPIAQQSVIQQVIRQLIERLCLILLKQDQGSLQLSYRLTCQDIAPVAFEVGCFRPSTDANHLWKLTEMQLERLVLREPVTSISISATRHDRLSQRQKELFDVGKGSGINCRNGPDQPKRSVPGASHNWCLTSFSHSIASLIDRMASRLGRQAIVRCVLQSDAQPEKAYRYDPLVGGSGSRKNNKSRFKSGSRKGVAGKGVAGKGVAGKGVAGKGVAGVERSEPPENSGDLGAHFMQGQPPKFSLLDRPLHLLAKPVVLENCKVTSNGSPSRFQYCAEQYIVSRHWGPERIETGWWRQRGVRRDYYRVETEEGFRFWIFCSLQEERWFLHGVFG